MKGCRRHKRRACCLQEVTEGQVQTGEGDELSRVCQTLVEGLKVLSAAHPTVPLVDSIPGWQGSSDASADPSDQVLAVRKPLLARQEVRSLSYCPTLSFLLLHCLTVA